MAQWNTLKMGLELRIFRQVAHKAFLHLRSVLSIMYISKIVFLYLAISNISLAFYYSPNFVPSFHSCIKVKNCSFLRKTNVPYFPVFSAHLTTKPHNVLNNGHDKSTTQMEKEMPNMWNHQHLSSENLLAFFELGNCNFFALNQLQLLVFFNSEEEKKSE